MMKADEELLLCVYMKSRREAEEKVVVEKISEIENDKSHTSPD